MWRCMLVPALGVCVIGCGKKQDEHPPATKAAPPGSAPTPTGAPATGECPTPRCEKKTISDNTMCVAANNCGAMPRSMTCEKSEPCCASACSGSNQACLSCPNSRGEIKSMCYAANCTCDDAKQANDDIIYCTRFN